MNKARYVDHDPETLEGWKGDIVRLLKGTCRYCSDKTDEPLIVQGLGFKSRVCSKCKLERGIK